jgi:hypothetical protein
MTITTDVNSSGLQPTLPTTLQNELITLVAATNPGYTANLPGSLIEDISSTDVGALTLIDQARVDLFNSITPYTANSFLLNQLGQIYGVQQGVGSNTSVYVIFSGTPGFVIPIGFTVSDGNYQYTVQDGGIVATDGQSTSLYCLATSQGSWAVPANTVTEIITSVPGGITLTVDNPTDGLPGLIAQPLEDYRAQVIQAGLAVSTGMPTFLKTQLQNVSGVQARLIAVRIVGTNIWEIIVGGGDPYEVGNAIFTGLFDISNIVGSDLQVTAITNAYPAVVTTNLNHGYTTGQAVVITGETGMSNVNGNTFIAIVLSANTFSLNCKITSMTWATGTVTVTTTSPHGLPNGTSAGTIYGVTPIAYNGSYTLTKTGTSTFTYPLVSNPGAVTTQGYTGFDSVTQGTYTSGGNITPNVRNITVSINDYPDSYNITFVNPLQQSVEIILLWNTISTNYVSPTAVAELGNPAIVNYINSIFVGQPINVFELQNVFQMAIETIIPATLLSRMEFSVIIDGNIVAPTSGTGLVYGDSESYFLTNTASVIINQG